MLIMSAAYIIAGAASVKLTDNTGDFLLAAFTLEEEAEEISEQEVLEQSRNGTAKELFTIKVSLILLAAVSVSSRPILRMKPVDIFQDYY